MGQREPCKCVRCTDIREHGSGLAAEVVRLRGRLSQIEAHRDALEADLQSAHLRIIELQDKVSNLNDALASCA